MQGSPPGLHNILHMFQLDDLNQVEVSFKANPGHIRINVKKVWTHLDSFRACKGVDGF